MFVQRFPLWRIGLRGFGHERCRRPSGRAQRRACAGSLVPAVQGGGGGDEVPQDGERFTAECARWLGARVAGPWHAWFVEVGGSPCGQVSYALWRRSRAPTRALMPSGYVANFLSHPGTAQPRPGKSPPRRDDRLCALTAWARRSCGRPSEVCRYTGAGAANGPRELLEQPVAPRARELEAHWNHLGSTWA
jgi:hypothetical protein